MRAISNFKHPMPMPKAGFTLVEVLTAVSLLAMFAGGALWTLTQTNNYAALSRLYTGAQVLAQNQIDLIMSKGPFNPQKGQVPSVLGGSTLPAGGTITLTETENTADLTIYSEPGKGEGLTIEAEERDTTVTDTNMIVNGRNLNMYSATVLVKFKYRGKDHQVQLNAMRASDVDGS
jgi:prepilin-type N-terminal cleavage/methylation domain-containing protein